MTYRILCASLLAFAALTAVAQTPAQKKDSLTGDPLAIAIPGTDLLQVFYRGGDNALWTRWRNPGATPSPPGPTSRAWAAF